jgi:4-hydroxy-tetrahydrodipicolinate synthase
MIDTRAADLRDRLDGRLIAAALTPRRPDGAVDAPVIDGYLGGLVADGVEALAVAAHTGRGPFLDGTERERVIGVAARCEVPVIVGVSGDLPSAVDQARQAATLGAHGLLVFPPAGGAVAYHDALWRAAGLPLIAFDLYLRPYAGSTLHELMRHPGVAGLKVARLHDAIACQAGIAAARAEERLAITGEDRMFGPSLMWGAQAAFVGLAAASVGVTLDTVRAWRERRFADFVAASARTDALALTTFCPPYEGYVQRMQWIAAAEGRIPPECAADPQAPELPDGERKRVVTHAESL